MDERIVRFTYKLNKAVEFHILHSFSPSTCVGDSLATEGQMLVEFYVMPARTIPWKVEGPDQRSKKKVKEANTICVSSRYHNDTSGLNQAKRSHLLPERATVRLFALSEGKLTELTSIARKPSRYLTISVCPSAEARTRNFCIPNGKSFSSGAIFPKEIANRAG